MEEKIKLYNDLTKKDYIKAKVKGIGFGIPEGTQAFCLKEELVEGVSVPVEEIDGLFITEEEYDKLPA